MQVEGLDSVAKPDFLNGLNANPALPNLTYIPDSVKTGQAKDQAKLPEVNGLVNGVTNGHVNGNKESSAVIANGHPELTVRPVGVSSPNGASVSGSSGKSGSSRKKGNPRRIPQVIYIINLGIWLVLHEFWLVSANFD